MNERANRYAHRDNVTGLKLGRSHSLTHSLTGL